MTTTCDVAVVGGGPAGAAAAITLARAGREVTVVDKAKFPRDKCCGDGLTALALRLGEELGLEPRALSSWCRVQDAVVTSPSGRVVRLPLPRDAGTYAAVVRRREYDAALLERAAAAGARVCQGHALLDAEQDSDQVTLRLAGLGELRARHVVGADGMWSPLRKALGTAVQGYRGEWHAFRQYFTGVSADARRDLFVWFEEDLLPGYVWSFPLGDGAANVGFGIQRNGKVSSVREMASIWRGLTERSRVRQVLGPHAEPEGRHLAWPIPARVDDVELAAGRALFAGDAAAATDVLTGEGIGQALLTGMLAGRSIAEKAQEGPQAVAETYASAVQAALLADHRMSALLVRAVRHAKGVRAGIRLAGSSNWSRRNFARWLFEDYPRALVATPRRWHRGMFGGPGSYRT